MGVPVLLHRSTSISLGCVDGPFKLRLISIGLIPAAVDLIPTAARAATTSRGAAAGWGGAVDIVF